MPWKDPEKRKAYNRAYNARPEHVAKRDTWRRAHLSLSQGYQKTCRARNPRHWLFIKAKATAKQRGLEWNLIEDEIIWPIYCPVLGILLDYSGSGERREAAPSFDRWDNSLGYVPGNVFIISWRANRIKWDCTHDELVAVTAYAVTRPLSNS